MCLKVSYISGGPQICSIAKGGLELLILMAQSPKCWAGRHVMCPYVQLMWYWVWGLICLFLESILAVEPHLQCLFIYMFT